MLKEKLKKYKIKRFVKRTKTVDHNNLENFIAELKLRGANPIETIRILTSKMELDFGEAKDRVFSSSSWKHLAEGVNQFTQEFMKVAAEDADQVEYYEDGTVKSVQFDLTKDQED